MECSWRRHGHSPISMALLFFTIALILWSCSLAKAGGDLINDVCSESRNPPSCIKALHSDPRSASADLKGLAKISINLSTKSAKSTWKLVDALKKNATNKSLKEIYDSCLENYDEAIYDLDDCTRLLGSGDFQGVNLRASAAMAYAGTCDDNFREAQITEPPQLVDASNNLQDLSSILLVISHLLEGN
ncbi:hypothetical protein ACH5RR_030969 [Cinchona calisaya]|uniref:Pectinesterase inhibitor domain-containing protein n=1 Tax=Cinchona calisaya TaxID=153742 RepID=A0ABD2YDU6_9GENT